MTAHTPEESEAADAAIQRAVKEAKRAARRFARHRKKHKSATQQRGQPPKRPRPKTGNGTSPREKRHGRARRSGTDDAAAAAEPSATADAAAQRALEKAQRAARCPARHRNTGGAAAAAEPSGRALVVVDPQRSAHCGLHAINNAFQEKVVNEGNMVTAAKSLADQAEMTDIRGLADEQGNCDIAVVSLALSAQLHRRDRQERQFQLSVSDDAVARNLTR